MLCSAVAVRSLTHFDDPAIGEKLAASYGKFHPAGRAAVIDALVSRPAFAKVLLDCTGTGEIPRADVTPFHARQIRSFNDGALTKQFGEVWGELRDSAADKLQLIAKLKRQLTPEVRAKADSRRGRVVFYTL